MNGARLVLCCVIGWCLIVNLEALPHNDLDGSKRNGSDIVTNGNSTRTFEFEPIDGFKVTYDKEQLCFRYDPTSDTALDIEGRGKKGGNDKEPKKRNIMKRIGKFIMMIPVALQLMQIPLTIASVKMALIRSILTAKVALFMLLIRLLFTPKPMEKIVIVKAPPKEYHEHYYHHHPYEEPEDHKPGWFGRGPSWLY